MRKYLVKALVGLALILPTLPAAAADTESRFIRLERNQGGEPVALQTAIAKYVPVAGENGVEIDLIGAVHIGEGSYFRRLNQEFEKYDVVLYELIAPEGARPPKGGATSDNPLALLQRGMTFALQLEYQLAVVDYQRANFVHADLSVAGLKKAMQERGEDEITVFFRVLRELMEKQRQAAKKSGPQVPDLRIEDLFDARKLKRLMAEQLADAGGDMSLGVTLNQLLVVDRNKACLKVLERELKAGKKRIAIFYGAAHLPDFEKRLKDEFGFVRKSTVWINAWNL